jgi:hypothetical protein
MIIIGNTLVSEDIVSEEFVCNLLKCKGACCEEGDFGAPLNEYDIDSIQENLSNIKPYMSKEGLKVLDQEGFFEPDPDNLPVTTLIRGRACVFAIKDEHSILHCAIEKAYKDGKSNFRKPISCFLYPVRINEKSEYNMVNYDRWDICSPACSEGKSLKVPVYKFLEIPLKERFGADWYDQIDSYAKEISKK